MGVPESGLTAPSGSPADVDSLSAPMFPAWLDDTGQLGHHLAASQASSAWLVKDAGGRNENIRLPKQPGRP